MGCIWIWWSSKKDNTLFSILSWIRGYFLLDLTKSNQVSKFPCLFSTRCSFFSFLPLCFYRFSVFIAIHLCIDSLLISFLICFGFWVLMLFGWLLLYFRNLIWMIIWYFSALIIISTTYRLLYIDFCMKSERLLLAKQ